MFCMEREGPRSTSTNEGDRWMSECATITLWSGSVTGSRCDSRRICLIGLTTGMICTTFFGPDSHETLPDEILASTMSQRWFMGTWTAVMLHIH